MGEFLRELNAASNGEREVVVEEGHEAGVAMEEDDSDRDLRGERKNACVCNF